MESKANWRWWLGRRSKLFRRFHATEEYCTWRLERATQRLLYTLPAAGILGAATMSLHWWEGHISLTGLLTTCSALLAQSFFFGSLGRTMSVAPSFSGRVQLVLLAVQEFVLMVSALQMDTELAKQHFFMSTAIPCFLIFSTIGYVPPGQFIGLACPLHLLCWLLFHGSFTFHLLALGTMHCLGALTVYILVDEAELESFNVLSKLALEQKYMETMHCSLQGMLSSIFDASCICNDEGDIRCWAVSPNSGEAVSSMANVTNLLDLTEDCGEQGSLSEFLQRMSSKAASRTDRVETLTLKLKKNMEVKLSGIKVPARRHGNRRASKSSSNEENRMLIGLNISQISERSSSKGRIIDSPKYRKSTIEMRIGSSEGNIEEPPPRRMASKSREAREKEPPVRQLTVTDTECLADDEGRERNAQRPDVVLKRGTSRLHLRAKGSGMNLGMDCNKVVEETTETFVDAHEHYDMLEQLGRGSISTVRKAVRKKDGLVVSLKIAGSKDKSSLVEAEFKMLQSIKHRNIISAFDYFETSVSSILVLEYFAGSTMEDAVRQAAQGHLPELTSRELFRSLLSAVCYLHTSRIIHRDVKPSNVMVSVCLSDLRLLDFNVAKRLTEGGAMTMTGTRLYFAPEVINGEPPSEANDVWGCGICLFYMLAGRLPWKTLPESVFVDHPALKVTGSWCQNLSEPCKSVIRQCLTVDYHWRPPVRTIMMHEWFWADGFDPCSDADLNADITPSPSRSSRRTTL